MYECVAAVENAVAGPSGVHHAAVGGVIGAGGGGGSNSSAEENIYESVDEVRQRHLMGNIDVSGCSYVSGIYGRLDVIGHGIGRIERHLSSSCGSGIDSHYGCIVQPLSTTPGNTHPFPGGYATLPSTSSGSGAGFNMHHPPSAVPLVPVVPVSPLALTGPSGSTAGGLQPPPALSAVSVQWLLVNRWLPLWIATSHDGGSGAGSGHYYCHGPGASTSSSASTYYHYQHQQQMDLSDYYCFPQHQQPQQHQLQVQQVPSAAAASVIQPSVSNTATNAANSVGGNSGTVTRRGGACNAVAEGVQVGGASVEGNAGVNREGGGSPSQQQQQSAVQQQQ